MDRSYEDIVYEVADPVATITLDRPAVLNAFTHSMLREIRDAVETAVADPAVVGIVITGAGRGFCAGLDASVLSATTAGGSAGRPPIGEDELPGLFSYFVEQPKPIIAAVNGVVAGGGFVLAAMCDLRFASTAASFVTIFSKRGLIAEHGFDVAPAAPRGHRGGARPAVVVAPLRCRRGCPAGLRAAGRRARRAARRGPRLRRRPRRQRLARRHRRHQAARLRTRWPRAPRPALVEADEATWAAIDRPDAAEGARSLVERRPPNFTRLGGTPPTLMPPHAHLGADPSGRAWLGLARCACWSPTTGRGGATAGSSMPSGQPHGGARGDRCSRRASSSATWCRTRRAGSVRLVEEDGAEVVVDLAGEQHVMGGDEHRVGDGDDGLVRAAPAGDAVVAGRQKVFFVSRRGPGGLDQGGAQKAAAVAGAGGSPFAGGLVRGGSDTGPRGEVAGGREPGHVDTDLGDDRLGA